MATRGDRGSVRYHRGGWELRVQVDGRRRTKRFRAENSRAGRAEAYQALAAWITTVDAVASDMTVRGAIDAYAKAKQGGWSPSTRATHGYHAKAVVDAFGETLLPDLTARTMQAQYEVWIDEGAKPGTVRRRHSMLAAALNYSERQGWILHSPSGQVDLPRTPRVPLDLPTAEKVSKAINLLPKTQRRLLALGDRRHDAQCAPFLVQVRPAQGA